MQVKSYIALSSVVIALVAVGCGGGAKKASPAKYVSTVCSSVAVWEKALAADTQKFESSVSKSSGAPDLANLKAQLVDLVSKVTTETKKMQSKITAVGEPDVKNGAKIETTINDGLSELVTGLAKAQKQASSLSVSSLTQFASAARALGGAVTGSGSKLTSTLNTLKSSELAAAANNEPACTKLG